MAKTITEQLKLFGLNPDDWQILNKLRPDGCYQIVHRKDKQFKLKGKIKDCAWTQLEWQI